MAATESHSATVPVDARSIWSCGRAGKTTWKQFVSRWRVSSMRFGPPHLAHLVVQGGALRVELRAGQREGGPGLLAQHGGEELPERGVPGGGLEAEVDPFRRRAVEQHAERLVLDAASEGTAAHHPGLDRETVAVLAPGDHGDGAQGTELVLVADGHQDGPRGRCQRVPVVLR